MYVIKTVIVSFLGKLQQNFAQSLYFPIHTKKRVVLRFHKMNAWLLLAKIPTCMGRIWEFLANHNFALI
jgi:hypothetical protein